MMYMYEYVFVQERPRNDQEDGKLQQIDFIIP